MLEVPSRFGRSVQHLDAAVHIVSLAVVGACRPLLDDECTQQLGLKWPNDIYIASERGHEKVGGVLVELIPGTESGQTRRILIGQVVTLTYITANFLL
jgi:biotin-(acetyl-CoA carboxylase) ligase